MNPRQLQVCLGVAAGLLGLGLFAPCMTLHPGFGEFTPLVRLINPELTVPTTYSILEGIRSMFDEGSVFIGVMVLLFSVVFPIWKLGVYFMASARLAAGLEIGRSVRWVNQLGKWSMLDVFVLAVLLVAVKGLPGGSRVAIEWGAAAFCASVLLSIYISLHISGGRNSVASEGTED
jgi:paraquat-inducible protein A